MFYHAKTPIPNTWPPLSAQKKGVGFFGRFFFGGGPVLCHNDVIPYTPPVYHIYATLKLFIMTSYPPRIRHGTHSDIPYVNVFCAPYNHYYVMMTSRCAAITVPPPLVTHTLRNVAAALPSVIMTSYSYLYRHNLYGYGMTTANCLITSYVRTYAHIHPSPLKRLP
jgi:hypothetical protein